MEWSPREVIIEWAWCGMLLSALNMPGCSISVLRLDDERLALLDSEIEARSWKI
jgi:dihydroxyacetone kinase